MATDANGLFSEKDNQQCSQKKILVVGLGLIGGSFAKSLKLANKNFEIIGYDLQSSVIDEAIDLGVIDKGAETLLDAAREVQVIMLSVPMLSMKSVLTQLAQCDLSEKIITDVGSCKGALVKAAHDVFGIVPENIVPGHPLSGSEKSGVSAARDNLFIGHNVVLTPLDCTNKDAVVEIKKLWECCGAIVNTTTFTYHDQVLALTSHLPHYIAFSLVDTLTLSAEDQSIFQYAAGGLRDFTRIAASDPKVWRDIALSNKDAVLKSFDLFTAGLSKLRKAIDGDNGQYLLDVFSRSKNVRDHFSVLLSRRECIATMKDNMQVLVAGPAEGPLSGEISVPGDKSISHRAIMLSALAEGVTHISGFLEGDDAMATLRAFRSMGVSIEDPDNGEVVVHGVGMNGLKSPKSGALDLGNAGTAVRLMAGLMSAQSFDTTLIGDKSLSGRPMTRIVKPLMQMGADVVTAEGGTLPMQINGGADLKGCHYTMPMASAQVQSCLLLAGMYAQGQTSVASPGIVRDHTNRMLSGFGYPVTVEPNKVTIIGGGKLHATSIDIPGDISSAAFFMVAASITSNSDLLLRHVGINPTRSGVIDILILMGANITVMNERLVGGEPVADIRVKSAPLHGIHIPLSLVPIAIDEFPVLFVAAALASGETVLRGAKELRVKECDRIQVMAGGLQVLGANAKALPDGMVINGGRTLAGGTVDSYGDHRIAMAFAVAALKAESEVRILDCANVATSFPGFVKLAVSAGMVVLEEGNYFG